MLMTIGAQKFPITAVCRIVIMVAVLVVDFQQLKIAVLKRTRTSPTHPGKALQCLRSISCGTLLRIASRLKNNLVKPVICLRH